MPITHEQKADVGMKYIENIKERLGKRKRIQEMELAASKAIAANSPRLLEFAERVRKLFGVKSHVEWVKTDDAYRSQEQKRIEYLVVGFKNGSYFNIPISEVIGLSVEKINCDKHEDLSRQLCKEIEFLTGMLGTSDVARFAAHVSRLWSPSNKTERITLAAVNSFINDFLVPARPAVCAI